MALLAKLPAIHIGLLFAILVLRKWGWRSFRDLRVWGFAVLSVLPAALWYTHARHLWSEYGNSLGLSNKDHWFGVDLLAAPQVFGGVLWTELKLVWTFFGVVLLVLVLAMRTRRLLSLELPWLAVLAAYFVLTAPTTGQGWARYYHVVAVPAAALIVGQAFDATLSIPVVRSLLRRGTAALFLAAVVTAGLGVVRSSFLFFGISAALGLASAFLLACTCFGPFIENETASRRSTSMGRSLAVIIGILLVAAAVVLQGGLTLQFAHHRAKGMADVPRSPYRCALQFRELIPPDALVLCTGGSCRDRTGRQIAYNKPYMFYWMDRKGFNICNENHSPETVEQIARSGASFFLAETADLAATPGFGEELAYIYPVVSVHPFAVLFDLRVAQHTPAGGRLKEVRGDR